MVIGMEDELKGVKYFPNRNKSEGRVGVSGVAKWCRKWLGKRFAPGCPAERAESRMRTYPAYRR